MKTLIPDPYFEELRDAYKGKNIACIKNKIKPLIECLVNSRFLNGKLRYHPLGFIYCKIFEYSNYETIRIHIWNKFSMIQEPVMNIHNHYYDVNSFVYKGKVSNELYQLVEGEEPTHSIYTGSYINENSRILNKTSNKSHLRLFDKQIIQEGGLYSINKTEIHAGDKIDEDITITIVFSESPGNPTPLIFGPLIGEESYQYYSNIVDEFKVDEIREQIARV